MALFQVICLIGDPALAAATSGSSSRPWNRTVSGTIDKTLIPFGSEALNLQNVFGRPLLGYVHIRTQISRIIQHSITVEQAGVSNPYRIAAIKLKAVFARLGYKTPRWLIASYASHWVAPNTESEKVLDETAWDEIHINRTPIQTAFRRMVGVLSRAADRLFGHWANVAVHSLLNIPGRLVGASATGNRLGWRRQGARLLFDKEWIWSIVAERLERRDGITDIDAWINANPEKAQEIRRHISHASDLRTSAEYEMKAMESESPFIREDTPGFKVLYGEVREVLDRLLPVMGFDPAQFKLVLVDSTDPNAFVIRYHDTVHVNMGLIRYLINHGSSKSGLAFTLAHELKHVRQWSEDLLDGRPVPSTWARLIESSPDENDADQVLAFMDQAGFNVREAGLFFESLWNDEIERKKTNPEERGHPTLGFLSHPPTQSRLRRLQQGILRSYWTNYFSALEPFSAPAIEEASHRTVQNQFRDRVGQFVEAQIAEQKTRRLNRTVTMDEMERLVEQSSKAITERLLEDLRAAGDQEEFFFAFYAYLPILGYSDYFHEVQEIFRDKYNMNDSALGPLFSFISRDQTAKRSLYGKSIENDGWFKGAPWDLYVRLLELPMFRPVRYDPIDPAPRERSPQRFYRGFNRPATFLGLIIDGLSGALFDWKNPRKISLEEGINLLDLLRQRMSEAQAYGQGSDHLPSKAEETFEAILVQTFEALAKEPEARQIDLLKRLLAHTDSAAGFMNTQEKTTEALTRYANQATPALKQIIADWISYGADTDGNGDEKEDQTATSRSRVRNSFFRTALDHHWIRALPGMGVSAEGDLDALFRNAYFIKHMTREDKISKRHTVVSWLTTLNKQYALPYDERLRLYEKTLDYLAPLPLDDGLRELYNQLFLYAAGELYTVRDDKVTRLDIGVGLREKQKEDLSPAQLKHHLGLLHRHGGFLSAEELSYRLYVLKSRDLIPDLYASVASERDNFRRRFKRNPHKSQRMNDEAEQDAWTLYALPLGIEALVDPGHTFQSNPAYQLLLDGEGHRSIGFKLDHANSGSRGRGVDRVHATGEDTETMRRLFKPFMETPGTFAAKTAILSGLPESPFRNYALYLQFIHQIVAPRMAAAGGTVDASKVFDLPYLQDQVARLSPADQEFVMKNLRTIAPLLTWDRGMENANLQRGATLVANPRAFEKTGETRSYWSADHERRLEISRQSTYYPVEFTELGGELSQLQIFAGLLAERQVLEQIQQAGLPFHRKLQTIRDYLYGPSLSRDHWLDLLISASPDLTSAQLEEVLAEIQNPSLRDRIAIKTLEKKRLEQPGEFRTLEGELQWIRHYFPDFSPIRDDLLLQVIDEQARTPPEEERVRPYLLQAPENARQKVPSRVTFGREAFTDFLAGENASVKSQFLLWILGISDTKTALMTTFQSEFQVNLDGLRRPFTEGSSGHYTHVGERAREEFITSLLYGENAILDDPRSSDAFLEAVFNALVPEGEIAADKRKAFRNIYFNIFRQADPMRKGDILLALLENVAQIRRQPIADPEERRLKYLGAGLQAIGLVGVKLGQFLDLPGLKDKAKPPHKGMVFDMIRKMYGDFFSVFIEIGRLLGSASIKAVYYARRADGSETVLKVKRPEADKKIEEDLRFLVRFLADSQADLAVLGFVLPADIVERIGHMIREELDFDREKRNQERLAANIANRGKVASAFSAVMDKLFQGSPTTFHFAVAKASEVRDNALMIEEFVDAIPLSDTPALEKAGIDVGAVRLALAKELLTEMAVDGFYHADPHDGNIFVSRDGKTIILIDVGAAGEISKPELASLLALIQAAAQGNSEQTAAWIRSLGLPSTPSPSTTLESDVSAAIQGPQSLTDKLLAVFKIANRSGHPVPDGIRSAFRLIAAGHKTLNVLALSPGALNVLGPSPANPGKNADQPNRDSRQLQIKVNGAILQGLLTFSGWAGEALPHIPFISEEQRVLLTSWLDTYAPLASHFSDGLSPSPFTLSVDAAESDVYEKCLRVLEAWGPEPMAALTPEKILALAPKLLFLTNASDRDALISLAKKIGMAAVQNRNAGPAAVPGTQASNTPKASSMDPVDAKPNETFHTIHMDGTAIHRIPSLMVWAQEQLAHLPSIPFVSGEAITQLRAWLATYTPRVEKAIQGYSAVPVMVSANDAEWAVYQNCLNVLDILGPAPLTTITMVKLLALLPALRFLLMEEARAALVSLGKKIETAMRTNLPQARRSRTRIQSGKKLLPAA